MSIRHVLVTGGAGYIGSHLVDALVARELPRDRARQPRAAGAPVRHVAVLREPEGALRARRRARPCGVRAAGARGGRGGALRRRGQRRPEHVPGRSLRGRQHARHGAAARHPGEHQASRREGDRGVLDWRLRRGRLPLRDARPGGADHPHGRAAGGARLGAALPAVPRARRLGPHARGQGALPRQHLLDDEVPPGRDGAAHRQDLRHPGGGAALLQRLRPAAEPQQPVRGRGGHLAEPAAQRQAAGRLRGRRAAARLRVDPRRGGLPGADARDVRRRLPAGQRRLRRDGDDSRHRQAPQPDPGHVDRAAGHAAGPPLRHPAQHRRHHAARSRCWDSRRRCRSTTGSPSWSNGRRRRRTSPPTSSTRRSTS